MLPQALDVPLHPGHPQQDDSRTCSLLANVHSNWLLNTLTLDTTPAHSTHALIQQPSGIQSIQKSDHRGPSLQYMSTIPSLGQSLQGEPLDNGGKEKSVEGPGQMGAFHMDTDSYSSEGR